MWPGRGSVTEAQDERQLPQLALCEVTEYVTLTSSEDISH